MKLEGRVKYVSKGGGADICISLNKLMYDTKRKGKRKKTKSRAERTGLVWFGPWVKFSSSLPHELEN